MDGHSQSRYRDALLDWMACAIGGLAEPAARAAREAGDGLQRPMAPEALSATRRDLAGERLDGALDDLDRPAAELLEPLEI